MGSRCRLKRMTECKMFVHILFPPRVSLATSLASKFHFHFDVYADRDSESASMSDVLSR